ncbi:hypothetical protein ONE63_005308 [Megalurothrips usitatus]|uniref:Small ribosomal subunit protein bS16m n=1 Tax=Megalurothrips usitatus TaxID=439358 RepID=A0AAV7XYH1_9NEOP|nr:hypothetical protein ONE63_005308 [Megalurothrips usitatus]
MPFAASGGRALKEGAKLVIRFSRKGCANRPFYHLQLTDKGVEQWEQCIEQLGSYDPLPNERNEKLASFNFERIRYWMGEGLAGFLPIHPSSYIHAWQNRRRAEEPEPPMPKKLTWRERKKILMKEAEDRLNAPAQSEEEEELSQEEAAKSSS